MYSTAWNYSAKTAQNLISKYEAPTNNIKCKCILKTEANSNYCKKKKKKYNNHFFSCDC